MIDHAAAEFRRLAREAAMEVTMFWKNRLRSAVEATISSSHAEDVTFQGFPVPTFAVITADGEQGFFRNRAAAVAYGRGRRVRFLLMPIDRPNASIQYPSESEISPSSPEADIENRSLG